MESKTPPQNKNQKINRNSSKKSFDYIQNRNPTQTAFYTSLKRLVKEIQKFVLTNKEQPISHIEQQLYTFSKQQLPPWSERVVDRMMQGAKKSSQKEWDRIGASLSQGMKQNLLWYKPGIQEVRNQTLNLINNIPVSAAKGISELAFQEQAYGTRAEGLIEMSPVLDAIRKQEFFLQEGDGKIYKGAFIAKRIAVTEYFRAANAIIREQAGDAGVDEFVSRASMDEDECRYCRALNGKVGSYSKGILYRGEMKFAPYHPQCKCYMDPVL